jgi:hypothetical protein
MKKIKTNQKHCLLFELLALESWLGNNVIKGKSRNRRMSVVPSNRTRVGIDVLNVDKSRLRYVTSILRPGPSPILEDPNG